MHVQKKKKKNFLKVGIWNGHVIYTCSSVRYARSMQREKRFIFCLDIHMAMCIRMLDSMRLLFVGNMGKLLHNSYCLMCPGADEDNRTR